MAHSYTTVDEDAQEVLYIDHNHLHMVGNVNTGRGATTRAVSHQPAGARSTANRNTQCCRINLGITGV